MVRDFGSADAWKADLKATGIAARGWAWTAWDWDEGRLFNYLGDAQNMFPVWNATPLVALDVYEHAYFLDYRTDRAAYIDAFFNNLDCGVVDDWVGVYGISRPTRSAQMVLAAIVVAGYLAGSCPWGYWLLLVFRARTSAATAAGRSVPRTCGGRTAAASPSRCSPSTS